jgi:hypothetical protein
MGFIDKYGNPVDPVTFDQEGDYYERMMAQIGDDPLEQLGAGMFGSTSRLRVMCWIEARQDPRFYGQQYWEETKHSTSSIGTVLPKLAALGLVEREDRDDGSRVVWYRRVPHPGWQIIHAANAVLTDIATAQQQQKAKLTEKAKVAIVNDLVGVLAGG